MKIFIYKNGMCDQKAGLGGIKQYNKASDVDNFLSTLCGSMSPFGHTQIRVFVTNDEVEQHEVDHHALMGDNYGLDLRSNSIKEVDTLEVAAKNNKKMSKLLDARNTRVKLERTH